MEKVIWTVLVGGGTYVLGKIYSKTNSDQDIGSEYFKDKRPVVPPDTPIPKLAQDPPTKILKGIPIPNLTHETPILKGTPMPKLTQETPILKPTPMPATTKQAEKEIDKLSSEKKNDLLMACLAVSVIGLVIYGGYVLYTQSKDKTSKASSKTTESASSTKEQQSAQSKSNKTNDRTSGQNSQDQDDQDKQDPLNNLKIECSALDSTYYITVEYENLADVNIGESLRGHLNLHNELVGYLNSRGGQLARTNLDSRIVINEIINDGDERFRVETTLRPRDLYVTRVAVYDLNTSGDKAEILREEDDGTDIGRYYVSIFNSNTILIPIQNYVHGRKKYTRGAFIRSQAFRISEAARFVRALEDQSITPFQFANTFRASDENFSRFKAFFANWAAFSKKDNPENNKIAIPHLPDEQTPSSNNNKHDKKKK